MNVLSLFDWISCGQVALKRLWIKVDTYYASEVDKFAMDVTNYRHPNTIQLGDIREWRNWNIDWSSIDLLFAGFSCQSWSLAGKQMWDKDPRWQLMWDMIDIRDHLLEQNPHATFLFENVRMKKEFQEYVNNAIWCEPILINSALVSAQNRQRNYRTNIKWIQQPKDKWIYLKDVIEDEVDEKYYLSEEYHKRFSNSDLKMNWDIKVIWTTVWGWKWTNSRHWVHSTEWKIWALSATCYKQPKQIFQIKQKWRWYNKWWLHTEKSPTLTKNARQENNHVAYNWEAIRKLTPKECERLQTLPDGYTLVPTRNRMMSDSQRYKQCWNWRTVDVISHILKNI